MKLPAQAFIQIRPKQLPPGSLFRSRGVWSLRVDLQLEGARESRLLLQGPHRGVVLSVGSGIPECTALAPSFNWFPAIDPHESPSVDAPFSGALMLTEHEPVILGRDPEGDIRAFRLDGSYAGQRYENPAEVRFVSWSAEIALPDRPFESIGMLFSVGHETSSG